MKTIAILLLVCHLQVVFLFGANAQQIKDWREDLSILAREMPRRHKSFYQSLTPPEFGTAVRKLDANIPNLTPDEFYVEIMRLVALAGSGNGHTYVLRTGDSTTPMLARATNTVGSDGNIRAMNFRQYPIGFYLFKDGLFVRSASEKYKKLLGARVLRIGSELAGSAYELVRPLVARDNEMGAKALVPRFLGIPEILDGLHITSNMEATPIEVEKAGQVIRDVLKPSTYPVPDRMIDMRDAASAPPPVYLRQNHDYYWSTVLPEHGLLYVQFNAVRNKNEQAVGDFFSQVFRSLESGGVNKLVLDLRFNPGGNHGLTQPMLLGSIRSKVNQPGHFFVITGRETFSAAMILCDQLQHLTQAVFVGEPTGGSVAFFGDNIPLVLPNTKLEVRVSTVWWEYLDSRDERPWLGPDVAAELSSSDYANNLDPAMEAIFHYKSGPDYASNILEAAQTGDIEAIRKDAETFQHNPLLKFQSLEPVLAYAGQILLQRKLTPQAISVLKDGLDWYPMSWKLSDTLAAAYEIDGASEKALQYYKKSLQLNSKNFHAEDQVKKLERTVSSGEVSR